MDSGKYYWLKLKKDFFKRHDIKIIQKVGGDKMVLIYLKMLCESVDHNGDLRFSDTVPYSLKMLSAVLDVDEKDMTDTYDVLTELGLIERQDDDTLTIPKVREMIGSASKSDGAIRQQRYRDKAKAEEPKTFKPPKIEEVKAYCLERGNSVDPEAFINFYESKGWMVGKNKMKDWQACVRTWERNRKSGSSNIDWIDGVEI